MSTAPALAPLVARTVPLRDPGPLLDLLPAPGLALPGRPSRHPMCWVRGDSGLVAWGEVARIETRGPDRFAAAEAGWQQAVAHAAVRDEVGLPGTGPVAFGSFSFSSASAAGGVLIVPEVVVGRHGDAWWLTTIGAGAVLPGAVPPQRAPAPTAPGAVHYRDGALAAWDWQRAVGEAIRRIGAGDLEKVVLARDVAAHTARPVDPRWLLRRLAARYPRCWTFSVDGLVGATPELLARREKGLVSARVLAGTIQRSGHDERDLALAASLARSSKDLEEHEYAVRSVAQALAPHCTSMNVPEAPFVLHLPNVMHLATDVAGVLADDASSLALAAALHPTAAVCGTPTDAAAALIDELEGMDRGRYAGPVGWLDAEGDGEWGIALRCAELGPGVGLGLGLGRPDSTRHDSARPDSAAAAAGSLATRRLRLFAGCGIVAGSDPAAELAEAAAKLLPMQEALASGWDQSLS